MHYGLTAEQPETENTSNKKSVTAPSEPYAVREHNDTKLSLGGN